MKPAILPQPLCSANKTEAFPHSPHALISFRLSLTRQLEEAGAEVNYDPGHGFTEETLFGRRISFVGDHHQEASGQLHHSFWYHAWDWTLGPDLLHGSGGPVMGQEEQPLDAPRDAQSQVQSTCKGLRLSQSLVFSFVFGLVQLPGMRPIITTLRGPAAWRGVPEQSPLSASGTVGLTLLFGIASQFLVILLALNAANPGPLLLAMTLCLVLIQPRLQSWVHTHKLGILDPHQVPTIKGVMYLSLMYVVFVSVLLSVVHDEQCM